MNMKCKIYYASRKPKDCCSAQVSSSQSEDTLYVPISVFLDIKYSTKEWMRQGKANPQIVCNCTISLTGWREMMYTPFQRSTDSRQKTGNEEIMRNIIIGTAGHVDHGKTALIKALTDMDTDRWEEEKRRGLSIGLGFAHFQLPDGSMAGIIDVPGHERFIRNMLTGVWGMDLILLVIDAVEGVKPQTVEHLNIIDLLGISNGIIVITKIDMVPEEQVEIVVEQVRSLLNGKLLDGSPLVRVSSITGQGIDELREVIVQQIASAEPPRRSLSAPRLPVDRVFIMSGFGAVVTGTLIGGSIGKQEMVNIMPGGARARVRGIEVHAPARRRA